MNKFTVNLCVYHKDDPLWFKEAINSVTTHQTCKPSEVVIVVDGPIYGELDYYVSQIENNNELFKVIRLPQNVGHAGARQAGLEASSNEWIAIMDADDISVENRFEMQLKEINKNPKLSVVGGQISEFIGSTDNIVGQRLVPQDDNGIKAYLKARCPMNLVTVMYRKKDVQAVGGFIDWYCEEDYYLWIRLAQAGFPFYNIQENLVNVRVGKEMYKRRGGWRYFKSEARLQQYMLNHKIINLPRYLYNTAGRFVVQVAIPNKFRGFIFKKLFRK